MSATGLLATPVLGAAGDSGQAAPSHDSALPASTDEAPAVDSDEESGSSEDSSSSAESSSSEESSSPDDSLSYEDSVHRASEYEESVTEYEDDDNDNEIPNVDWTVGINELPGEIICDILEMASGYAVDTVDFAFRVSLVCRLWQSLAFAAPKLWRRIDAGGSPEVVRNILARSKQLPLDVRIYLNPTIAEADGVERIEWFTTLISPQRHRFKSFTFHYYYPSWFEAGSSLLTSNPVMEVDSMDVRRLQFYIPNQYPSTQVVETVAADHMTLIPHRLRYDGIRVPAEYTHIPMFSHSLKSLDIRWSDDIPPSNIFLRMLSEVTSLEYLRLTGFGRSASPFINPGSDVPYRLPSLREAVFESMTPARLGGLSTYMETPVLERLLIDLNWDNHPCHSIVRICQQNPQLQHFRLNSNIHMKVNICTSIFTSLPSLTHLYLSQTGSEDETRALNCLIADRDSPESVLCPNLASVTFDGAENVSQEFVAALVKSRVGLTGVTPIKSLKWRWVSLGTAEELWKELKEVVEETGLELILECTDLDALSIHPDWWEPAEEWLSEGGELDLDSGDEELLVPGGVAQSYITESTRRR